MAGTVRRQTLADVVLPFTNAAINKSQDDMLAEFGKGNIARGLGASTRQLVTVPIGLARDTIARPTETLLGGVGNFLGGLVGSTGSEKVNVAVKPAAAAAANPVATALAQGRTAKDTPLTPQERMMAFLDSMTRRPMTLDEAQAVQGMMPATKVSAKDSVVSSAANLSQQMFANQVAQAQELGKTDKKAGQDIVQKATDQFLQRLLGLGGANPLAQAQAQLMAPGGEE